MKHKTKKYRSAAISGVGFQLPYTKLDTDQKNFYSAIMREGGRIIERIYNQILALSGQDRRRYSRRTLRTELFNTVGRTPAACTLHGVNITLEDVQKIYAIRARENEILMGWSNMVRKVYFARFAEHDSFISEDDCMEEGVMALVDAIYHYTKDPKEMVEGESQKKGSSFTTFAYWAIFRRMGRALANAKRNYPWTVKMRNLYIAYLKAKSKLQGPANFEDIVELMQLNDEDRKILQAALVQMISVEIEGGNADDSEAGGHTDDYSTMGVEAQEEKISLDPDQLAAIDAAELTDWERAVLIAFLSGDRGWQTEVAAENVNPETGKPYSRRAPHIALKRIFEKISLAYEAGKIGNSQFFRNFLKAYNGSEVA